MANAKILSGVSQSSNLPGSSSLLIIWPTTAVMLQLNSLQGKVVVFLDFRSEATYSYICLFFLGGLSFHHHHLTTNLTRTPTLTLTLPRPHPSLHNHHLHLDHQRYFCFIVMFSFLVFLLFVVVCSNQTLKTRMMKRMMRLLLLLPLLPLLPLLMWCRLLLK